MSASLHKKPLYRLFVWLGLIVGLAVFVWLAANELSAPSFMQSDDFVEYWSAARLNLSGGNPYDPQQLTPLQLQTGRWQGIPLIMWNPPWTLALVMPFGLRSYPSGRALWLLLNIVSVFFCADWFWRFFGGSVRYRWIAWIVGASFGPALRVLKAGQIAPLLLLGIVGFLYFEERRKDWFAGAALALITIKPHLLYLLGVAVLIWIVERRRWSILLGGVATLAITMGAAYAFNPALVYQYLYAVQNYPPQQWATPTLGAMLRVLFGAEYFWLQFLPPVLGIIWFFDYWRRNREGWCWREHLPFILLVSVLTAAYGWTFDYVVFLLPVVQVALWMYQSVAWSWYKVGLLVSYLIVGGIVIFSNMEQSRYWWLAPFFLGWYLLSQRFLKPQVEHKEAA